jgi:hypothetical protein
MTKHGNGNPTPAASVVTPVSPSAAPKPLDAAVQAFRDAINKLADEAIDRPSQGQPSLLPAHERKDEPDTYFDNFKTWEE